MRRVMMAVKTAATAAKVMIEAMIVTPPIASNFIGSFERNARIA
jgi:hypothetical protein